MFTHASESNQAGRRDEGVAARVAQAVRRVPRLSVHRVLLPLGIGYARTSVFKSKDASVLQGKGSKGVIMLGPEPITFSLS